MRAPAPDGVALSEAGAPILFYRSQPGPGREPWRVNYVHPLYSMAGAVITEDAPPDHLHQRGVFWAWRRILVDGVRVADGWVGDKRRPGSRRTDLARMARRSAQIDAQRDVARAGELALRPRSSRKSSTIRVPIRSAGGQRRIDFEVRLRALRDGVELAGTDDEKGYGGLSLRFATRSSWSFASDGQVLQPLVAAVHTGEEVTFTLACARPGLARLDCVPVAG